MLLPAPSDVAALVRLPAVLSVPGDVFLGAAFAPPAAGWRATLPMVGSSALLYLAGMALNDWADREVDAVERPGRPIPSGRVAPGFALALAGGLTVAGVAVARRCGRGGSGLRLAAMVWAYDLALKSTPLGPAAMATCRALDVLAGAGPRRRAAVPAAGVVAAHTAVVTTLSRNEVSGRAGPAAYGALVATGAVTAAALRLGRACSPSTGPVRSRRGASAALAGVYAVSFGGAQWRAARRPSPAAAQRAVGAGVLGLMPLESSLLAGSGAGAPAALVAGAWPLARHLARRRAVT